MIEWMGAGLGARDAPQRYLATGVVMIVAIGCMLGFFWMVYSWPFWIAFPAGLVALASGIGLSIFAVGRIVPKKVKPPHNRFGDE